MRKRTFSNPTMEMLMTELRRALTERNHTRLNTYSLQLRCIEFVRAPRQFLEIYTRRQRHLARMDLEDPCSCGFVGEGELDLAVETPRTEEGRVEDVDTIRCGNDLRMQEELIG